MNKTSLGGQYGLTASYVPLNTLLGIDADTLGKIELSIDPSHAATVFLELSDAGNPVQISAGVGYTHEFSAVKLSTIRVKGTPGDTVALVGESLERIQQGSMY
jgi:hypothetical protein